MVLTTVLGILTVIKYQMVSVEDTHNSVGYTHKNKL